MSLKIKSFSLKTQKLNNKDIIGSGGYGVVYELKLDDSMALAIKRLNHRTTERDKGFERELEAMADIKQVGKRSRKEMMSFCETVEIVLSGLNPLTPKSKSSGTRQITGTKALFSFLSCRRRKKEREMEDSYLREE